MLILVGVSVQGCQSSPPAIDSAELSEELVWPSAPARARVRWQGEIREPTDSGASSNVFQNLWRWISGKSDAHLVRPHGVAVDPDGRLWVADPGAQRIHVFDFKRKQYTSLPRKGDPPLLSPIGITHDSDGVAYVSDSESGEIRRFDAKGHALSSWLLGEGPARPTGVVFDQSTGLLWVVDTGSHGIVALNAGGEVVRRVGHRGTAPGAFNFPTHLTVDSDGRLFVTDTMNFRVQVLSGQGKPVAAFGKAGDGPGSLSKPKGIGRDREGHIYVVDSLFDNVQIFDEEGKILLYFGEPGSGPGQFWLPTGICITADDKIYVADSYNRRVQVFEYFGE